VPDTNEKMPQVVIQPQKTIQTMIQSGSLLNKPRATPINSEEGNNPPARTSFLMPSLRFSTHVSSGCSPARAG
jgi:hypothetical protein